jgi:hypothetical protein
MTPSRASYYFTEVWIAPYTTPMASSEGASSKSHSSGAGYARPSHTLSKSSSRIVGAYVVLVGVSEPLSIDHMYAATFGSDESPPP